MEMAAQEPVFKGDKISGQQKNKSHSLRQRQNPGYLTKEENVAPMKIQ